MTQESPIDQVVDALKRLDERLGVPGFEQTDPDNYQKLLDQRDLLDEKRLELEQAQFAQDDAQFQKLTIDLNAAADQLNDDIEAEKRIDDIITDTTALLGTVEKLLEL